MRYREIIVEDVQGMFGLVFHRTHTHDTVQAIRTDGFQSGPRAMYGEGIYATYSLISQFTPYMIEQYGEFIIKSRIKLTNFLILDPVVAKQIYGRRYKIADQVADHFKEGKRTYSSNLQDFDERIEQGDQTSVIAREIVNYAMVTGMRGIVYTGRMDGRCVVCYERDALLPISWTRVTMEDIEHIRSQKMIGAAEKAFAAGLTWERIINRDLVRKALTPNIERDLVTDPAAIRRIPDPTPEQQRLAVNADPSVIRFIKNPTEEVQAIATVTDSDMIDYIANPSPAAIIAPLRIRMNNEKLLARLPPATLIAALRISCLVLPAIMRNNPDRQPSSEQWEAAWHAPDADEMIQMFLRDGKKQFETNNIPEDALRAMLTKNPAHLHYFKDPSPHVVAAAVTSPNNHYGNTALSNCASDHIAVDCSAIPEPTLRELIQAQPNLVTAIKDVSTELVSIAMKKSPSFAKELDRNYNLPPELKALVPKGIIFPGGSNR